MLALACAIWWGRWAWSSEGRARILMRCGLGMAREQAHTLSPRKQAGSPGWRLAMGGGCRVSQHL